MGKLLACVAGAVLVTAARAGSATADFRDKASGVDWDLGGTEYHAERGRKFPADAAAVLASPQFVGSVTSVTFVASITTSSSPAPEFGVWAGADPASATLADVFTISKTNDRFTNTLAFAAADAVHAVKFTCSRNGNDRTNLYVERVTVRWAGGPFGVPGDLEASNMSSNSFTASWNAVEEAEGYALRVWQEVAVPRSGDDVWSESFGGLAESFFDVPGWTGHNFRRPSNHEGIVQVGTSSSTGTGALLSPAIPAELGMKLVVEGQFPDRATGTMPVCLVRGDTTNLLADVAFGKSPKTVEIDLPALTAECQLLFSSPTNGADRRVWLDSVAVVSNYVAAGVAEVAVPGWEAYATATTSVDVTGLSTGEYYWAVQTVVGAERSAWSAPCPVFLEDAAVRMIPLTNRECVYTNDWDWLGAHDSVCTNGIVGLGLLAAKSKAAWNGNLTSVTNGHKFTLGGFYSQAMADASDRAFVMRATGEDDHVLTVTVVNNGKTAIESFDISYLGVQTFDGATNAPPRRLEAAWCTATAATYPDPFAAEGWTAAPDLDFAELSSVKAGPVFLTTGIHGVITLEPKLEPCRVFSFRLKLAKGSNAPALGIDNLRLAATFAPPEKRPTYVIFR